MSSIFNASGTVVVRSMQRIKEEVIIWYSNWTTLLISLLATYYYETGLSICKEFNTGDWILIVISALSVYAKNICKIKALYLQSSSKLQVLDLIQTLITFVVQIFVYQETLNPV